MARDNYNEVKGKNTYSKNKKKKKKETASQKVQSPSVSSQRAVDPKEARRQESARNVRTTASRFANENRRTAGQNQKTYGNTEGRTQTIDLPQKTPHERAEDRARSQRVKSGIQTAEDERKIRERNEHRVEVAKNTGRASVKGAKDTLTGYGKTLADVDEMAKSNEKWTEAKAMKLGVDRNDRKKMAEIEKERQESIKQSREFRMDLQRKQEERQAKFDEQTKDANELEKALYGAAESGTGMLIDTGIGAVTGTGQIGALASMGLRTYGTTRGQAEKEGATENEDRLYSLAQAGKEMGTELMFQGAGLAKGYAVSKSGKAVGLSLADKAANALTKGLTGKKADIVSAGVKVLGGTGEENIEELAGWMADPVLKEAIYGRNVRKRTAESLRANLPEVTSKEDADRVAAYFSTDKFETDLTQDYINSGLSKKEASELAQEMRDYYVAYYSNDEETLNALEEDLSQKLSGQQKLSKSSWSSDELIDTFASTTLLTLGTGLPGGITSSVKGNQMFDSEDSFLRQRFGDNAVKLVTDAVKNTSDGEMSAKAQAMEKRLSEGKDLTGTQKYELAQGYMEKVRETSKKAEASNGVVVKESRKNDYVPTQMIDQNGQRIFAKETQKAFDKEYENASKTVDDLKGSISETDMDRADAVKKAVADLHVGGLTVGDAHEFGYGNELARETLKRELGIDLDQYVVKTKDGKIDYAATNDATENALFELNAQNAIDMAKVETDVYIDDMKGEIDTDLLSRFGGNAQTVWKDVNQDLDPHRDLKGYLATADAVSFFVSAGRNTDLSVDEIMNRYANVGMNKSVDDSIKRQAIEAGRQDRIDANTPGNGQTVEAGQKIALKKTEKITTGELIIEEGLAVPDSDQQVYKALADATNANIHLVSSLTATEDGMQINGMSKGNDIYLNLNASAEENLGYVFMHEMTHQIKQYAPNEYLALENLVRDRWFNKDQKYMDRMIKDRIALYSAKADQTLTEEEALEEIIADAMAEAMDDPNFASEVCEQNPDLAEQILSAIRSALRSIRQMFAGGKTNGTRFHNGLLSYLGILDDAERMWLDALAVAKQNKANGLIADWQDKVNKQNSPRLSAEIEANESRYSIVEDPEVIKELEEDSHVTTYRAMALIDGKLYPPMSTKEKNEKGRWTLKQGMDLGQWVESDITTDSRMFNKEGEFILKKDDGSSDMGVAYNPYIHSSDSMMNDQFSTAYRRPNLVVVEGEIPESELTNGYRAEHDLDDGRHVVAKDSTGITDWKAGEVQAKLSGKRTVYLTQHFKPTRIVPDSEVAKHINDKVAGTDIAIPYNVVTPSVRRELQKLGTKMEQNKQSKYYVEDAERFSVTPEQDAEYMSAVESGDMETAQRMVDAEAERHGYHYRGYHGSNAEFTVFDPEKRGSKNWNAPSAYMGFFAAKSRSTAEAYIGLNQMDALSLWTNEESKNKMESIKSERGYEARHNEYLDKMNAFEDQYKSEHGFGEIEDRLNLMRSRLSTMKGWTDEMMDEFMERQRISEEADWNKEHLNDMESAWYSTEDAKAYREYEQDIIGEWEQYEIERRGYKPNIKELYIKMENPFIYDFKGEGRDTESFASRMAYAKEHGYDGCIFMNVEDGGDFDDIYTVFSNDQFKSADPVTYDDEGNVIPLSERFNTESPDIRYSISETDSEGNELSEGQREFFKDSKVVDQNGNLLRMYHGSDVEFYEFDRNKIGSHGRFEGAGFNFTPSESRAKGYSNVGTVLEGYLNITNPLSATEKTFNARSLAEVIRKIDPTGDDVISNYARDTSDYGTDAFVRREALYTARTMLDYHDSDVDIYSDLSASGSNSNAIIEAFKDMGYDGVIHYYDDTGKIKTCIAFDSEQFKDIDNLNPTMSPDRRYSIPEETVKELEDNDVKVLEGGSVAHYSLTSLKAEKEAKIRKALKDAGTFTDEQIDKWIDDIWSIASIVENNRDTLDYWADRSVSSKKSNQAYMYSFDFSTLCPKRTIYQGTLNAIYKMLPNAILMPDDLIHLRKLLKNKGYQAPCGFCYVESERKWLDQKVGEFLKQYKGDYIPKPTELTATDSKIKEEHPEAWNAWIKYRGKLGQGGPRLVDPRTDYRGEILRMRPETVKKLNDIGGLRFQSYSDFEVYHMLDMMQAIRDASAMGLKVQMYTKIPACAEIFGATGIKINLSLVAATNEDGSFAKDENGNLIFDSQEGMPYEEAMRLRDMYPENVGTILVGHSRQHIIEAMADDRIDFIIPFHKSGWSMKEFAELGLGGYEDVAAVTHEDREKYIETGESAEEIYSGSYWEYDKPGKWNAEKYLRICKERKVTPSFYSFLQDNGDGSWSLKEDGSTDGYWKLLIDGKMYDNDGKGSPQKPVKPEFNIEAAKKLMDETIKNGGSADTLPVADDVVEDFVKEYVEDNPDTKIADARLSISAKLDDDYDKAISNSIDWDKAQELVDEAAKMAGYTPVRMYHGTLSEEFTEFKRPSENEKMGMPLGFIYVTKDEGYATGYSVYGEPFSEEYEEGFVLEGYINIKNPLNLGKNVNGFTYTSFNEELENSKEKQDKNATDEFKRVAKAVKMTPSELLEYCGFESIPASVWRVVNSEKYANLVRDLGYDSIHTKEYGADCYGLLEPNQIKSSDPITYDEDGDIIPLSERFDPNNDDIRYSMPTQDTLGRILTDNQMEYFKNSQARDSQGKLVPVYHTTEKFGGFTIFNPIVSDDHRSLFFSDSLDVSLTYAKNPVSRTDLSNPRFNTWDEFKEYAKKEFADYPDWDETKSVEENMEIEFEGKYTDSFAQEITFDEWINSNGEDADVNVIWRLPKREGGWMHDETDDPTDMLVRMSRDLGREFEEEGYYECYLNLENPLIVDAHGNTWRNIIYTPTESGYVSIKEDASTEIDVVESQWISDDGDPVMPFGPDAVSGMYTRIKYKRKDENGQWKDYDVEKEFYLDEPSDLSEKVGQLRFDGQGELLDQMWSHWESLGFPQETMFDIASIFSTQRTGEIRCHVEDGPTQIYLDNNGKELDVEEYLEGQTDSYTTRDLAEYASSVGKDGVIIRNCKDLGGRSALDFTKDENSTIYIAFSSNQIKDIHNENPTENPDIRYSIPDRQEALDTMIAKADSIDIIPLRDTKLEEQRVKYSLSVKDFENMVISGWDEHYRTYGRLLDDESVKPHLISMMSQIMKDSETGRKYKSETLDETIKDMKVMYFEMKNGMSKEFADRAWAAAERIVNDVDYNDDLYVEYKGMRDYLEKRWIQIPEALMYDEDFAEYMRDNSGRMRFRENGSGVEAIYKYLRKKYPKIFPEDLDHPVDMLLQMDYALDLTEPYRDAYSSEEYTALVKNVAESLCEMVRQGEEYRSVADDLYEKFDARSKAMKQRHNEAKQKIRDQYGEKIASLRQTLAEKNEAISDLKAENREALANARQEKKEAVENVRQEEKEKRQRQSDRANKWKEKYKQRIQHDKEVREAKKEKKMHRALYDAVLNEYNDLTKRLLKPSKDKAKNIPEQLRQPLAEMLYCFDLEKERSKELEEMYRIPTRTQLNFRQMKDSLEKVIKEEETAYEFSDIHRFLKDKMTEIADKMDMLGDHSIDALDNNDIAVIKDLMKGLNSAIKNYQQFEIDGEKYEAQQIADKVGEGAKEHESLYGKGKKYTGARAFVDNIVNMGELTPIYFFKQIKGMYDMYRQIRKGFDSYVRNEKDIIDKIAKILAPYYKTNRKGQQVQGSEIEDWRHLESAETFNTTYGSLTLTIAQRMSLYCLYKRDQARNHMLSDRGGVVASEITAGSKMHKAEEMLKGKVVEYKQTPLTPEDVENIIATLTPEQIKIADDLQELMSNDMSKLGNQASMKLTGIEMYKETEYFPIKIQAESKGKDLDNIGMQEKVRNPGFSNPLQENASNPIILDDIFTVVASHCNEMNLYASYAVPLTSFMKVYNGSVLGEDGKPVKVQTIIKETYGEKAIQYIDNFLDDINGNSFKRHGGLDDVLDKALGQAKKASVFANLRVALQQPTAIVRAFAVMHPKYFAGVRPSRKATQEMFEHCPIAQWKSWGYYDTHFGRDIEDVMMGANVSSKMDVIMSDIYGEFDNMTWGMIWQAVKKEVKAENPKVDEGTQEFWDLCSERASYVFDMTQVVDSPFHRSNDMRSKNGLVKQLTSFQSEPTLSFNVLRQGFVDAYEEYKKGNKAKAEKALARVLAVWTTQAVTVAIAQSFVDALRRKGADDDEDPNFFALWWQNFMADFVDDINPINNVYYFKEIVPPILNALTGQYVFGQQNLTFQWVDTLTKGIQKCKKKWEKGEEYKTSWYDCLTDLFGGIGYLVGVPVKTMMRGMKNAIHWFNKITGAEVFADDGTVDKAVDGMIDRFRKEKSNAGSETTSGSKSSGEESAEDIKNLSEDTLNKLDSKAEEKVKGYTGSDRDEVLWDVLSDGYTKHIQAGDMDYIYKLRVIYQKHGGNIDVFNSKVASAMPSIYKKTFKENMTEEDIRNQEEMRDFMLRYGMSETELSDICYHTDTAKDLKAALRMGNEQYILDELVPLIRAGLTREDFERLYKNRNRGANSYHGKYDDPKYTKTTGQFIWPADGVITSRFGHRDSPTAGASSNHPAIDIGASQGTPVVASDGGVVISAGSNGGYGNSVGIKHSNGMVTYYNHLYSWNVKVGDQVGQGQQIGQVGSTGISTGPHLDFKIIDAEGNAVDPEEYLNKRS